MEIIKNQSPGRLFSNHKLTAIYAIINVNSGSVYYVGGTRNYEGRMAIHLSQLRNKHHPCKKLQKAWDEFGEDSFRFTIMIAYESQNVPAAEIAEAETAFLRLTGICNKHRVTSAGSFNPKRGENISEAKRIITDTKILEVKKLLESGMKQKEIAVNLSLTQTVVSKIKNGQYDRYLGGNN